MPYPNEHSCRLHPPGRYKEFARVSRETHDTHKGYSVVRGKKEDETWEDQAFRYPTRAWEEAQARRHCETHDGNFEAARPAENVNEDGLVLHREISALQASVPIREEIFEGRRHLVVPVVAMVEGVHCGTKGCCFYPASEIGKYVESWNGVPVPILHPEDEEGYVSANSPDIIERRCAGRFFNAFFDSDGGKLRGEFWFDIGKLEKISPQTLSIIRSGNRLEVSTALWTDDDNVPGEWKGEAFDTTSRNYRPDHIAVLPGQKGACSWDDGCGAPRLNKKIGENQMKINILQTARTPSFEGTETVSWGDVSAGFADYRDAYYQTHDEPTDGVPNRVQDAPQALKNYIASKTLLGDPSADSVDDLIFFPVVNPKTNKLNEGALRAVISGRGTQADIPAQAKNSAQRKARQLLNEHFGAELEIDQAQGNTTKEKLFSLAKPKIQTLKSMVGEIRENFGLSICELGRFLGITANELSHEELRNKIQQKVDEMDNPGWIHFVREVYNDNFVYEARAMNPNPSEIVIPSGTAKLYQRGYSIDANDNITLKDDAKEVKEVKTYVPVEDNSTQNNIQKENIKKEEVKAMEKEKLIEGLIACERTRFNEEDREWLNGLPPERLEKLKAVDPPKPEPVTNQPPPSPKGKAVTLDDFIGNAPPEIGTVLRRSVERDQQIKANIIKDLLDNKQNQFTEEELKTKDIEELEKLAELARIEVDYTLQGGAPAGDGKDKVPDMPSCAQPVKASA